MSKFLSSVKNHLLTGIVFTVISIVYLNIVTIVKFYLAGGDFLRLPASDKIYAIVQILKGNSWPIAVVGLLITLFMLLVSHKFHSLRNRTVYFYLAWFLIFGLIVQTHQLVHSGLFPNVKSFGFLVASLILALVGFGFYYLTSRGALLILERVASNPKILPLGIAAAVAVVLFLLLRTQFGQATSISSEDYNVLLLTVDTLRKDHLSYDGYFRSTSPFLDKFSREGVIFENAYSAVSLTLPSMASVITGKRPMHHGVRNNSVYALADTNLTLAEVLKKHGFVTGAIIANEGLRPKRGYGQGFDYYGKSYYFTRLKYDLPMLVLFNRISRFFGEGLFLYPGGDAYHTTNLTIKFLKENKDKRFFCWVFYMDPHLAYAPPRGYDDKFCRKKKKLGPNYFHIQRHLRKYEANLPPRPEVVKWIRGLYDGEILYTDYQIHRLLRALEDMNLLSKTLIIFSADHGESLADHYYYIGHGKLVYNANIAVPLVIRFPDRRYTGLIKDRVSNLNIMPTILDFVGLNRETFPGGIDGVSLMPLIREGRRDYLPVVHSQSGIPWSFDPKLFDQIESGGPNPFKTAEARLAVDTRGGLGANLQEQIELKLRTVIKGNWKLIYVPVKDSTLPTGRRHYYELYDISSDWEEKYDLFASQPEVFRELKSEIESWCAADTGSSIFAETIEMDQKDLEALKALGYIQ
jgi:arylsulfatase A-like enzyme